MKTYKFLFLSVLMLGLLFSCSKEYERPPLTEPTYDGPEANITIKELKDQYKDINDPTLVDVDYTLKAVVIGNDVSGNIFKQLYVQDETGGINLGVDQNSVYTEYRVGQEVYINLKGLYMVKYGGQLQIGYDKTQANRIQWEVFQFYVHKDGWPSAEKVSPKTISLGSLNDDMVNTLVQLDNVYFTDGGKLPFAEPDLTVNRTLKDGNGRTIIVRNSGYANFAAEILPKGGGTVVGILSKFNSDWQLYLRTADDCQDFGQEIPGAGEEPGGGEEPSGTVFFKETFDSGDAGARPFIKDYTGFDNKDVKYSDPSGGVSVRTTNQVPTPHLWFPASKDGYLIIEGINLSGGSDLVLKYDLIANLFSAGEEMNLNAMKVKVNDKEITVPSKVVSNEAGDNNKTYEVTLTGIPGEEDVKIEFWADPALNTKGLRLDNIIIESVPGATTGVKAK